ncbi:hypothetical protein SB719_22015, partial [Pantoea sp. SIMBA_079]
AHTLAVKFNVGKRRAGDGDHGDVVMRKVLVHTIGVVSHEGAAGAAFLPSRREHEMLHQKLGPAIEEIGQRA